MKPKKRIAKKISKNKKEKVPGKPGKENCLSHELLKKYKHAMVHGNAKVKAGMFLTLLGSLFSQTESCSREIALKTFEHKYMEIDPSKDSEYIYNALMDIITDKDISKENSYPVLLENVISNVLSERNDLENLHFLISRLVVDVYFSKERKDLLSWPEKVMPEIKKDRHKIIINAPMGLGKTYQIAKALATSNYSAVVFMPTKIMRDEIYETIKFFTPGDGEVLLVEGIDEYNCKEFNQIKEKRERKFTYNKQAICMKCDWYDFSEERCKTLFQERAIADHRIIVTTHAQYMKFYHHYYWYDPSVGECREVKIDNPQIVELLKKEKYISKKNTLGEKAQKTSNALGKELKKDFLFEPCYN